MMMWKVASGHERLARLTGLVRGLTTVVAALGVAAGAFASVVQDMSAPGHVDRDTSKYLLYGQKWPDGVIRWAYNDSARSFLISSSADDTLNRIQSAMNKWSAVCGVRFSYLGPTQLWPGYGQGGVNVFGWEFLSGTDNGVTRLRLDPPTGAILQADVAMNLNFNPVFDVMLLHEVGHMLGLRHSNVEGAVMSGPNSPPLTSTSYTQLLQLQADDIAGCRALYGAPSAGSGGADLAITSVVAGTYALAVGQQLLQQQTLIRNQGTATAAAGAEVRLYWSTQNAITSASVYSGWSCTLPALAPGETAACQGPVGGPSQPGTYWFGATVNENRAIAESNFANNSGTDSRSVAVGGTASTSLRMIEFYHPALDYYFMTSRASDISLLDTIPAFQRTGQSFVVLPSQQLSSVGIRRYYFDRVALGGTRGSHFYTAVTSEQQMLASLNPGNVQAPRLPVDEGIDSFAFPPLVEGVGGACQSGQIPVYRLFRGNARFPDNPNHRFTIDIGIYNAFRVAGWDGEGVKLCVPPS